MIIPRTAPSSTMTALTHHTRTRLIALHPVATLSRYSSSSSSSSSSKPPSPSSSSSPQASSFSSSSQPPNRFTRPGPPQLPRAEQAEFNRLVQSRSNSLQFNRPAAEESGNDELHPNARRQPQPDFEGEENPKTGEVGGPKKDPLIWRGEYTFNGRATDF